MNIVYVSGVAGLKTMSKPGAKGTLHAKGAFILGWFGGMPPENFEILEQNGAIFCTIKHIFTSEKEK